MTIKNTLQKTVLISTALVILSGTVNAQNISPAQRQEFTDGKTEVNAQLQSRHH